MFRQIAGFTQTEGNEEDAKNLFKLHPSQLAMLLEQAWWLRKHDTSIKQPGPPDHRSNLPALPGLTSGNALGQFAADNTELCGKVRWDHLIYAYMIENTYIYEIFERVVHEFLHGEKFVHTEGSEHWLRNTEELFYKDTAQFLITAVASRVRPDLRATRRNAYYRMFGIDLNPVTNDKKEYPYIKAEASNMDFVSTFENFLREVWIAIENVGNTSGTDPTDDDAIANLAERLHNMLISRRKTGNLSREEFYAVATMSWFHLTLEFDSPIVKALKAEALPSPEERLKKIADQVGLKYHTLCGGSFFKLAEPMSRILTLIETINVYNSGLAPAFYNPTNDNTIPIDMNTIITNWSITTGHDMKTRKTQVTA